MSDQEAEEPQERQIEIDLPTDLEVGVYANFALVHHTQHELTIDFCQLGTTPLQPGRTPKAKVVSRIHLAPTFVMPLLQAISSNVTRREDILREIEEEGEE